MLTAQEIRTKFLDYFRRNGHEAVSSSSIIPADDPTLLFTNAGMVQFKRLFQGLETREYSRATTSQKCLRVGGKHNDLENVGRTARHHTFFEMLGNFSFGDYFKEDAIRFAWNFITEELKLPKENLYITIYLDDDEAYDLWRNVAGVAEDRIMRLGEKDNFWSMGDTGPCGPCSEIHIDQGEHMSCGEGCGLGKCDCDRFLEIWNLVFMQYNQLENGEREPLPKPSIDTGMGLERIAAVCQGVYSNYDTDLFQDIISHMAGIAGVKYREQNDDVDTALRVIADHSRAVAFMIADGIQPSNEGRGYVLRRLIRRAYRFGRLIGMDRPFLCDMSEKIVDLMGDAFPELKESRVFMARLVREEEIRFSNTLDKGLAMLEEELEAIKSAGGDTVPGDVMFKLYDTFGFPVDIVRDVAEKHGIGIDEDGYDAHMAEQKQRAKAAWKGSGDAGLGTRFAALLEDGVRTDFVGYSKLEAQGRVVALLNAEAEIVSALSKGEKGYCVTSATPFYGESGGQVGDTGLITTPAGRAEVTDCLKPAAELTVHQVTVLEGELVLQAEADLRVTESERHATARNHTTTHLLHAALRKVLGDHVKQSGSLVGPDRLRFDFTHISAMTPEEIRSVEHEVNRAILADVPVQTSLMAYDKAVEAGAMALFGEKYDDEVRVVSIDGESVELCGGTHLRATGQAGSFYILSETGVAAGVRRIEAATGFNAVNLANERRDEVSEIASLLKGKPGELAARVRGLQKELKSLHKELEKVAASAAMGNGSGGSLMDGLKDIGGVKVLCAEVPAPNVKALRDIMDDVRSKLPSGIACLVAATGEGKASLILYVSKDLHDRFTAPALIKEVASEIGGSGGGRPDLAQAGGTNPEGAKAAFAKLEGIIG